MPKEFERKLEREAQKKGLGKKRTNAYVYGTLRKTGWKPRREQHESRSSTLVDRVLEMRLMTKWWLSPSGEFVPVTDHTAWDASGKSKHKDANVSGWVRGVIEGSTIFIDWNACNRVQRSEVKDMAIINELTVTDDKGRDVRI